MATQKRTRRKRVVLDIGASAIRLCELTPTKEGMELTKYHQKELPWNPSMDQEEREEARQEALREILRESKVRARKVVLGIPGQSVFSRNRALPPVPEHKVASIVRYEIQQQIPFSLDQIALDYEVLDRTEAGGYEVLMAACKVDVADKFIELLKNVRRTPDAVDACPLAVYNWAKHTGELGETGECVAIVDLGASTTDIVVERGCQFRFTRSLNIGGNDVTKAIATAFKTTFGEAERVKREHGFAPTGDSNKDGKGGEVVGGVLQRLAGEINRSFAYYRAQPGGAPVARVVLTGGGACLRNIAPYLKRELGVDVRVAQPLEGLSVGEGAEAVKEQPARAMTALGLALRNVGDVTIDINLVPPRIVEYQRSKEQTVYWGLSLAVLALIVASIIPVQAAQDQRLQENIETLRGGLRAFAPDAEDPTATSERERELQEAQQEVEELQNRVQNLDDAYTDQQFWLPYLDEINNARPEEGGVWLSFLSTTRITDQPEQRAGARDRGERGGFGGMGGQRTGTDGRSGVHSTGFPGLSPTRGAGGTQRGGMTGFGGRDRGARGQRQDQDADVQPPSQPNGISIRGYAQDAETLLRYVERLEESDMFIEDGVHFDEATANEVPMSELDNASAAGARMGGTRSTRGTDDNRGGMGSLGGRTGAFGGAGGRTTGRAPTAQQGGFQQERTVRALHIELQFAGEAPDDVDAQPDDEPPEMDFGGFGFGRRDRDDD